MIEALLDQLRELVGSDDFEMQSEEIMERLSDEGAGLEIIADLLSIMEQHPLEDFGMPGAMVHFIEQFYPDYIPLLIGSFRRAPSLHTVWILSRCINGAADPGELLSVLRSVAENAAADPAIRDSAKQFLEYQENK